jgi:hypothetical protein
VLLCIFTCVSSALAEQEPKKLLSREDYQDILQHIDNEQAFQRFLDKLPTIETGEDIKRTYYVLEGDLRLTRQEVLARLKTYLADATTVTNATLPTGKGSEELYVMVKAGVPTKWPVGQRALTYAVKRSSFPSLDQYIEIVNNLRDAVPAWVEPCECGLSFSHASQYDDNPSLDTVTFVVSYMPNEQRYLALSFFPADPKDQRYLYIMEPYFTNTTYDKVGMLRHELGHILGYRHAHIGGVPGCELYEESDKSWVALSPYDSRSVMHYPCGGGGSVKFILSDRDKLDHHTYYAQ